MLSRAQKTLQQIQAIVQVVLLLGPYEPANAMVPESVRDKTEILLRDLSRHLYLNLDEDVCNFEVDPCHTVGNFCERASGHYWVL